MNIVEYAEFIVKGIVKSPEMVKVSSFKGDEDTTILEIMVPETEVGSVIGRDGVMAKSLRTMIQAYSYIHQEGKVKINIDSF